jgi:hypothetical protein
MNSMKTTKDLFELLSKNERVIVYSDEAEQTIYTWNQSRTLQVWMPNVDGWIEIDIRTLFDKPASFEEARTAAKRWAEQ